MQNPTTAKSPNAHGPFSKGTVREAMKLAVRYQLSHWDALIVAAAIQASCDLLYSEAMQHEQVFDDRVSVKNPFIDQ